MTPDRFHTTGMSDCSNVKLATSSDKTTSIRWMRSISTVVLLLRDIVRNVLISSCEKVNPLMTTMISYEAARSPVLVRLTYRTGYRPRRSSYVAGANVSDE